MRAARGFSLVELMIVLAVIGLMAGLVAPQLLDALPGMRVSGAARQVLGDLRLARTRAIERGLPVVVKFTPAAGSYVIALDETPNDDVDAGETVIRRAALTDEYTEVEFRSNVAGAPASGVNLAGGVADAITFLPNGSARESGEVYLRPKRDAGTARADRNRRIQIILATGNVRIQTWDGAAWK